METSIRELKHKAKLQEWSGRILDCRSSGESVRAWCRNHGIGTKSYYRWEKIVLAESAEKTSLPEVQHGGALVRVEPGRLSEECTVNTVTGVRIRHGNSMIELPSYISVEQIAVLVRELERYV